MDQYIACVHGRLDELRRQLGEAMTRAEVARRRVAVAEEAQARLGQTLLHTQRAADATIDDAEKEASAIVRAAEVQAQDMLDQVSRQAQALVAEAHVAFEALDTAMRQPATNPVTDPITPELSPTTAPRGAPPSRPGATGPNSSWVSPLTGRRLA